MFVRASGSPNIQPFVKTASTALDANGFVKLASGQLVKSAASDISALGLCLETISSGDSDFATARQVLVDQVDEDDLILGDINGGTVTAADVGKYFTFKDDLNVDGTTGAVLAAGATGAAGPLVLVGYISATQGYFYLSSRVANQTVMPTA